MIRAPQAPTSPQQALAEALDGTILGPSAIQVGRHLVVASPLGIVRVDGRAIGMWSEATATLAARVRAQVAA